MSEISGILWKAAAGLLALAVLLGALLLWQARTSPALERLQAAQAAFPGQELTLQDVTEPSMTGNLDHTDGAWPASEGEGGTSRSDITVVEGDEAAHGSAHTAEAEAGGGSGEAEKGTHAADTTE